MDYVEQVEKFKKILVDTSEELMDTLGDKDTNMDKFDMKISVAGTILTVPMNADSFTRMLGFLDAEIKEEKEMQMQRLNKQNKQAMVDDEIKEEKEMQELNKQNKQAMVDDEIKEEKKMQELNKQNKQAMVDALLVFRKGYMKVLDAWENYNIDEKLVQSPYYPFDRSFDELEIVEWCDDVLSELKKVR